MRGFMISAAATLSDISELGSWNVNLVRYPLLNYQADIHDLESYSEWLDQELLRVDQISAILKAQNIRLLLELHTPPGGYKELLPIPQHRIFSEHAAKSALIETWRKIAVRYKDDPTVWGYEFLNEPAQKYVAPGLKNWNKLSSILRTEIRKIDKSKKVVINPVYGDAVRIHKLKYQKDKKAYYSVHMYYPQSFTHQGLYDFPIGPHYPKSSLNKTKLRQYLKPVVEFQKKHKAKILIHEFSVVHWAPKDSAFRYLRDLVDIFETNKWHWIYHEFRGVDAWNIEQPAELEEAQNISNSANSRQGLLRLFFAKNKQF